MPEISDHDLRQFLRYQDLGTVEEIRRKQDDLEKDNKGYRDRIKDLEAKVPEEGTVSLSAEEAKVLNEFRELGETPEALKAKLEAGQAAVVEIATTKREKSIRDFAAAAGLAEEAVATLAKLPDLKDAQFEVRVKKEGGEEVRTPYLKLSGDENAMPFDKAKDKVPELLGLRTADPSKDDGKGTEFLEQPSTGSGNDGNKWDRIREKAKKQRGASTPKEDDKVETKDVFSRLGMASNN